VRRNVEENACRCTHALVAGLCVWAHRQPRRHPPHRNRLRLSPANMLFPASLLRAGVAGWTVLLGPHPSTGWNAPPRTLRMNTSFPSRRGRRCSRDRRHRRHGGGGRQAIPAGSPEPLRTRWPGRSVFSLNSPESRKRSPRLLYWFRIAICARFHIASCGWVDDGFLSAGPARGDARWQANVRHEEETCSG